MAMNRFALALLLLLPGLSNAAPATLQEASQLFRQGQPAQALDKINSYLAGNAKDAQGRFLKGLLLAELNRTQEAIKTFSDLSDDYPELPEPYNNLAVLYASQGQYERAKNSLERAIRTHPSYATAHENLGDIYAKMASVAYDKALQLDKSNTSAQMKLALVKDIFTPAGLDKPRSGIPGRARSASLSPSPATLPAAATAPTQPEPAKAAAPTASDTKSNKPAADTHASVEKTVLDWAVAWSKQDVPAYLAFYAANFEVPAGMPRKDWEAQRQQRLSKPQHIRVEVSNLAVTTAGKQATVTFAQRYESNLLKSRTQKTLVMEEQGGQWKIVREK